MLIFFLRQNDSIDFSLDVLYEISAEALPNRSDPIAENAHLSLILVNENGDQSEKIRLKRDRKTNKISERYQGKDLGKVRSVDLRLN